MEAAGLADVAIDDVSDFSAEAVVLPIHTDAEGQPSASCVLSVASSDRVSLVGSDVVASALVQQMGVSASDIEIAVTATSVGSGVGVANEIQAESAVSAAVNSSQIAAMDLAALLAAMFPNWRRQVLRTWPLMMFPASQRRPTYCPCVLMLKASPLSLAFFP